MYCDQTFSELGSHTINSCLLRDLGYLFSVSKHGYGFSPDFLTFLFPLVLGVFLDF